MNKILILLKEIIVQCLEALKGRFYTVLFVLENAAVLALLITMLGFINALVWGVSPFSEIVWWDPVASGLGLLIGVVRGLWDNVVAVPGTLYLHIKVVFHCFLVMAPASGIVLTVFFYMCLVQSGFFVIGLFSENPLDRNFGYFLKQNRFLLLGLSCIVILIVVYILLYDPRITLPKCPPIEEVTKNFIFPLGAKISSRSNTGLSSRILVVSWVVQVALFLAFVVYQYSFKHAHPFQVALNHLGFQEPASPLMEGLIALHSDIWAIMLFVAGFILYTVYATLYSIHLDIVAGNFKNQSLIEIVWTTMPLLILCIIAVPSCVLLYSLDEIIEPSLTMKAMGRERYWSYEYGDYEVCDSMASPNEPNSGWFSSMKTYWGFGKNNQSLSPLEANQKTLGTLQNAQQSTLDHCQKYDNSLIKGSLSPRSHDITLAKRAECYFHYDALSQCSNQVASNIGSTNYNAPPKHFCRFFWECSRTKSRNSY